MNDTNEFIIKAEISFGLSAKDGREAMLKATQALYNSPEIAWDWAIKEIRVTH